MNIALLLSGGTGTRLGSQIPKQYIEVNGKPVIGYSHNVLEESSFIDGIIVVASEEWQDFIVEKCPSQKRIAFAKPGRNRQESIYHGLCVLRTYLQKEGKEPSECTVLIHDAARPYLTLQMIADYYEVLQDYEGVLPVLPMKDTVYLSEDGESVSKLLPRQKVFAGQAPEIFKFEPYLKANEALLPDEILQINGSTEPAVLSNMNIRMVMGSEQNIKITTAVDLQRFCEEKGKR